MGNSIFGLFFVNFSPRLAHGEGLFVVKKSGDGDAVERLPSAAQESARKR